jgi:hypothetical protein
MDAALPLICLCVMEACDGGTMDQQVGREVGAMVQLSAALDRVKNVP